MENVKKRAVSPLKGTPKRRRMSIAENLICSTEKLKSATKTTPKRIPVKKIGVQYRKAEIRYVCLSDLGVLIWTFNLLIIIM